MTLQVMFGSNVKPDTGGRGKVTWTKLVRNISLHYLKSSFRQNSLCLPS